MDVALELFVERGAAATPVTTIEAAAGLSPGSGSFYRHFKDKEALLAAVVEREVTRVGKDPDAQVENTDGAGEQRLATQLRSDLDYLGELRSLIMILLWERNRAPELAEWVRKTSADRGIELGVEALRLAGPSAAVEEDEVAAATVMQSAMIGYFLAAEYFGASPADVDPDRFTAALARLLTNRDA
ncbi:TetR family transcriptional regulator [Herbihabitans rhizosphaerae]|uniref:TetR family transcriptional regulator n=2 Tax=Herbihabitans rhizosphaerae TaxID=1872711 RepID=A0A4Q7L3X2_9PSEU|nr:TetR family transcriptional regulator [Herbihabitans rhizosphaerae]